MTDEPGPAGEAAPDLQRAVAAVMDQAWTSPGFCVPNRDVYPHQWLWDSCFHSVVWTRINPVRAVIEIDHVLARMAPNGFVPHMTYWNAPTVHADLWGRTGTSAITQPPMWGLALAEVATHGVIPGDELSGAGLLERAARGLVHLLDGRERTAGGLVPVYHPWETGCDDSARWDSWSGPASWKADKLRFVRSLVFDHHGAPVANPEFAVGSVGFSALVAWNCRLLSELVASPRLRAGAEELTAAIQSRWDAETETWWDEPLVGEVRPSCGARTLDSMLALLVDPRPSMFEQLVDPTAFGAPYGPRGVHCDEPTYDPDRYWRGPAWPQLSYLLWRAAGQAVEGGQVAPDVANRLADSLIKGAGRSGLAEYWNPDTGQGRGAAPQTWAGLAICLSPRGGGPSATSRRGSGMPAPGGQEPGD